MDEQHYENHEIAEAFPHMSEEEINALAADIGRNGLLMPIILFEGKILDGRHRNVACDRAGVQPRFEQFTGADPIAYCIAINDRRRHMTTSQRAMVAANLATLKAHRPKNNCLNSGTSFSQKTIAKEMKVSRDTVQRAKRVLIASPELAAQVTAGEVTVHAAEQQVAAQAAAAASPAPDAPPAVPEPVLDCTGWEVPEPLQPLWKRRSEITDLVARINSIQNDLLEGQRSNDPLFAPINISATIENLQMARSKIKTGRFFAVCLTCQGRNHAQCAECGTRGLVSKFRWNTTPENLRAIRSRNSQPVQAEEED